MKIKVLICILWIPVLLHGNPPYLSNGTSRAVVIGISDYQDEEIPDLSFAHRDAIAFADWLNSSAGGNLPKSNIQLLLNEQATIGRIVEALGWLIESSQSGDQAIIYFSGHGDTEQITKFKRGFLLTYNAPPRSYMTGGVLALRDVRDIVTTLSESGVEVVIITDACRSGALAGSNVNGSQFTSAQLATQYANEVKILSCQPEEYSSEGKQWGGGHGAFSYHLLNGLYGMADRNEDYQITLSEIDRYLEDNVPKEVAPLEQTPLTIGNRKALLAFVDEDALAIRKEEKMSSLPSIASVKGQKSVSVSSISDSTIQKKYDAFHEALAEKRFFEPKLNSADTLYQQLIEEPSIAHLHKAITRRYAAELQDDAQEALNAILKVEPNSMVNNRLVLAEQYKLFPLYLKRAGELLGNQHYMYKSLIARSVFFDALVESFVFHLSATKEEAKRIINKYRQSLAIEPFAPHTNYYLSLGFMTVGDEPDSAYHYAQTATEQAPTWLLPYTSVVYFYLQKYKRFDEAKELIEKCKNIDSSNYLVYQSKAAYHFYQKEYKQAIKIYKELLQKDSTILYAWNNLGASHLKTREYDLAEAAILKSIEIDPDRYVPYYTLGFLYAALKRTEEAKQMLLKAIQLNPRTITVRKKLGVIYYKEGKLDLAKDIWLEAYELMSHDIELGLNLATISIELDKQEEAINFLDKAFESGKRDYEEVIKDFSALKGVDAYEKLLKKYFPKKHK